MSNGFDTVITSRAAAAVTAAAGRPGPAAHTARAWIDTLTTRVQLRCERRARQPGPGTPTPGNQPMRTHTRLGAGIITIQLGAAVLAGSPTSTAATITISPGDLAMST